MEPRRSLSIGKNLGPKINSSVGAQASNDHQDLSDHVTAFGGIGPFLEVGSKANTFEQQAPSERNGSKDVGQLGIG